MWWEYNNKRRNRFDRKIRNYTDIHEWAIITGFVMLFICMLFGFTIYGLSYEKYPILVNYGFAYLICGIMTLIMIGIHMALDN